MYSMKHLLALTCCLAWPAITLALGIGMVDQDSALWQLVDAFRNGYQKFTYAISISE